MNPIIDKEPYKSFLANYQKSEDTRISYGWDLALWDRHLNGLDPLCATQIHCESFINQMKIKCADKTIKRRMATLKKFYGRLIRLELITKDPTIIFEDMEITTSIRIKKALTIEHRKHLLASLRWNTYHEQQVSLMVWIGMFTGLRLNEIRKLKWTDFNFEKMTVITIGKRDKEATIPISKKLRDKLKSAQSSGLFDAEYVFTFNGKIVRRSAMVNWPREVKKWCGWGKEFKFTCHSLRHCFITSLAEAHLDIDSIMALARHSEPGVTMGYIKTQESKTNSDYKKVFG